MIRKEIFDGTDCRLVIVSWTDDGEYATEENFVYDSDARKKYNELLNDIKKGFHAALTKKETKYISLKEF